MRKKRIGGDFMARFSTYEVAYLMTKYSRDYYSAFITLLEGQKFRFQMYAPFRHALEHLIKNKDLEAAEKILFERCEGFEKNHTNTKQFENFCLNNSQAFAVLKKLLFNSNGPLSIDEIELWRNDPFYYNIGNSNEPVEVGYKPSIVNNKRQEIIDIFVNSKEGNIDRKRLRYQYLLSVYIFKALVKDEKYNFFTHRFVHINPKTLKYYYIREPEILNKKKLINEIKGTFKEILLHLEDYKKAELKVQTQIPQMSQIQLDEQ